VLTWDGASVSDGGSSLLRFRVKRCTSSGSCEERGTTEATVFSYTDTIEYSTDYTYSVTAENLIGLSPSGDSLLINIVPKASPSNSEVSFPSPIEAEVDFSVSVTTNDSTGSLVTTSTLLYLVVSDVCEVNSGTYCARVSSTHSSYVSDLLKGKKDFVKFSSSGSGTYSATYKARLLGPYTFAVWQVTQGGLRGDYWDNIWHSGAVDTSKLSSTINLEWGKTALITTYAGDFVSGIWQGFVKASYTETYTFYAWADDGVKVFVSQSTVIDSWDVCCNEISGTKSMTAGELVYIEIHWKQLQSEAKLKLEWKSTSQARQVIPSSALYYFDYFKDTPVKKDVAKGRSTASLCYVENLSSSMVAGTSYTVNLYSVDADGKALTNSDDVFNLVFSGAASKSIASSYDSSNKSVATIVLTTAGSYSLDIKLYGTSIKSSPFTVTVTAGAVSSSQSTSGLSTLISSGSLVAGTKYSFSFTAKDAYGNSLTTTNASVVMTITWSSNYYTSPIGVDYPTDYDKNYGKNYSGYADGTTISFTIPRAANYSVVIKINDAQMGSTTTMTIVPASINSSYSIAVYPSTTSTAGATYTLKVQGRDLYYNNVKTTISSLTSTSVSTSGTATLTTTLSDDSSNLGVYKATLTFEKAGDYTIAVSINSATISNTNYKVTVSASSSVSTSKSEVTGLPSSSSAGSAIAGAVYIRDAYSNTMSSYTGTLTVSVTGTDSFTPSLTQNTDKSYSFSFTPITPGTYSVSVTYNSVSISPTPKSITVSEGQIRVAKSTFETFSATSYVASAKLKIIAKDAQGNTVSNPVNDSKMLPQKFSASLKGTKAYDIEATFDDLTAYLINLSTVVAAGDYSVVLTLLQQGGLQAFYYQTTDFSSLSGSLSTHNHSSSSPSTYTKVESTINLNWGTGSPSEFTTSQPNYFSVLWTGKLQAKYTEEVTFYVTCSDLVRLTVGSSILIDSISTSTEVNAQSAKKTLTQNQFYDIKVEYVERTEGAYIKLEWASARITREVIPSTSLFAKLNSESSPYSLTLKPGDTSATRCSLSTYSGDSLSYTVANTKTEKRIQLTAKDSYGNVQTYSTETFSATLIDGSTSVTVTVAGESSGLYKISFTAATAGTYSLRVYYSDDGTNVYATGATISISLGPSDSSQSEITGNTELQAGLASTLVLYTKTAQGEYKTSGGDTVTATISGVSSDRIKVSDNRNGSYDIVIVIDSIGSYTLETKVNSGSAVSKSLTVIHGQVDANQSTVSTNSPITTGGSVTANLVLVDKFSNAITTTQTFASYLTDESDSGFSKISISFSATSQSEGKYSGSATISSFTGTLALYVHVIESRLKGEYFDNTSFSGVATFEKYDEQINYSWGSGVVGDVQADNISIRWTGYLKSTSAETYVISIVADKALVYLNSSLLLDTANSITSESVSLSADTFNTLQVDYVEETGDASIVLSWKVGSGSTQVIPASAFYHKSAEIGDGPQSVTVNSA